MRAVVLYFWLVLPMRSLIWLGRRVFGRRRQMVTGLSGCGERLGVAVSWCRGW
jgi:hypothetical protein